MSRNGSHGGERPGYLAVALGALTAWAYWEGYASADVIPPPVPPDVREHGRQVRALLTHCARLADERARVLESQVDLERLRADVAALTRENERLRGLLNGLTPNPWDAPEGEKAT